MYFVIKMNTSLLQGGNTAAANPKLPPIQDKNK